MLLRFQAGKLNVKISCVHLAGQKESMRVVQDLGFVVPRRIVREGMVTQG